MCGIAGILRMIKPGSAEMPPEGPLRSASGAWVWHGPPIPARDVPRAHGPWLIDDAWLDELDQGVAWRGPDGAGRFRDRVVKQDGTIVEVALVHRRLSIIDIAGGAQPMVHETSQAGSLLALVFNGCIYNHRELRRELQDQGATFSTDHSDTEVVLAAWRHWGPGCLARLDGMYAFALWDRRNASLSIARDRFGEKPLYITEWGTGRTAFASVPVNELPGLKLPIEYTVDEERLALWMGMGWAGQPPLMAVNAATSGEVERLGAVGSASSPDASLGAVGPFPPPDRHAGEEDVRAIEEALAASVRRRLEADVPLGTFLSGGIDSALVTLLAARADASVLALTVRMPHESYDESQAAAATARAIGVRHEILECGADAANDLLALIARCRLPFTDSSILPTYWLCRAASARVKVALGGDGGDELFVGYERYRAVSLLRRWGWLLRLLPQGVLSRRDPRSRQERLARLIDAARGSGWPELGAMFPPDMRLRLFGVAGASLARPWVPSMDVEWARRLDVVGYLRHDLLRKTDIASMAAGVEVRSPFLEPRVMELAFAFHPREHMAGGRTKRLLRALARRYFPPEIVDRPKQGFAIPISDWFRTDFGGLGALLLDHLAGERPFGRVHEVLDINMTFVRRMLDEHWAAGGLAPLHTTRHVRPRDHGQRLFALLSLAIWARALDAPRRATEPAAGVSPAPDA